MSEHEHNTHNTLSNESLPQSITPKFTDINILKNIEYYQK